MSAYIGQKMLIALQTSPSLVSREEKGHITGLAYNVYALAMAGHSMNFQPEQKYSKRTNS